MVPEKMKVKSWLLVEVTMPQRMLIKIVLGAKVSMTEMKAPSILALWKMGPV